MAPTLPSPRPDLGPLPRHCPTPLPRTATQVASLVQEAGQKLTRAQEAGIQKALTLRLSKNKTGVTLIEVMNCVSLYIDKAVPDYS